MKVFLIWSGPVSHQAARISKELLETVVQGVECFISDDIETGQLWRSIIAEQLGNTDFGIVFVTAKNRTNHWIHFEAGAVAKAVEKSNVVPVCVGLRKGEIEGPLADFQMVEFTQDGFKKIVQAMAKHLKLVRVEHMLKVLGWKWDEVEAQINDVLESAAKEGPKPLFPKVPEERKVEDKLEEVLVRMRRLEANPERETLARSPPANALNHPHGYVVSPWFAFAPTADPNEIDRAAAASGSTRMLRNADGSVQLAGERLDIGGFFKSVKHLKPRTLARPVDALDD